MGCGYGTLYYGRFPKLVSGDFFNLNPVSAMTTTNEHSDATRNLRWQIYGILIMISAGLCLGRILAVDNLRDRTIQEYRLTTIKKQQIDERRKEMESRNYPQDIIEKELQRVNRELTKQFQTARPTLSANDRSRFCTIRVLVEPELRETRIVEKNGQKVEQVVPYAIDKIRTKQGWDTIDMVCHTLPDDPEGTRYLYSSKPPLLPTVMAIPYWVIYKTTGITFDTHSYLLTRITLILCHLMPLVIGWYLMALMIERFGKSDWARIFAIAFTCFATFLSTFVVTLNNHLPAIFCIIIALYAGVRIWFDGDTRKRWFALAGFFAAFAFACEMPSALFFAILGLALLIKFPRQTLIAGVPAAVVVVAAFFVTNYIAHQSPLPAYSQKDWYFFENYQKYGKTINSYWSNPQGPDVGEANRGVYAFHTIAGHHGILSLTPVWLIAIFGVLIMLLRPSSSGGHGVSALPSAKPMRDFAIVTLVMTLICIAFYLAMELQNRNYGGMTCGHRWTFWLIPFWTLCLLPALDGMAKYRLLRWCGLFLLLLSAMSVSYPLWNPWSPPWLQYFMDYLRLL